MRHDFAHVLNNLRRENNLSQKKAADDLGISQALLSHYENGVREPKLEFIVKACEYYGVSTDYILGRTSEKSYDGKTALVCSSPEEQRCADAAALILAIMKEVGDEQLSTAASKYVCFSLFTVLAALRTPMMTYEPLYDAALKAAESTFMFYARKAKEKDDALANLTDEALREKYPKLYQSVVELEEHIKDTVLNLL